MSAQVDQSSIDMTELVLLTNGFSGAEIVSCCSEAAMMVVSDEMLRIEAEKEMGCLGEKSGDMEHVSPPLSFRLIHQQDIITVIKKIIPQITADMIQFYETYKEKTRI